MMRTLSSLVICALLTSSAGLIGCDSGTDDSSTDGVADGTAGTDGSGGESGSGGGTGGDGDGDPATTDPDCPLGSFDCPCNDGICEPGLTCGMDGLCSLGGDPGPTTGDPGTTTGDPTTTGGTGGEDPYDPEMCMEPSEVLGVEQIEGQFCATPCVDSEECPAGPAGTEAACAIASMGAVPNFCALICTPGSEDCPIGSTCKTVPMQPTVGLCTYP